MFLRSSLASFIVGAWEKQLRNFVTNSSSEKLSQDSITCLTAPADFLNNSVLNPLLLALQAWLTSSIQSSKCCLLVPSKVLMAVNIESLDFIFTYPCQFLETLLCLASLAGCHHFPSTLIEYLPISISVALRSWPGNAPKGDW